MKKLLLALACSASFSHAYAGSADYVAVPGVELGEKEIDFKIGSLKANGADRESAASLGFGYGVTGRWFSEVYVKYKNGGGEPHHFDAYEWENKFQLTEPGQYPVDLGFLLEIERPQDRSEGIEVVFGPLFQSDFGKVQVNGNILFKRNYRAAFANPLTLNYQWQAKYRWTQQFEYGLQGFGEMGQWDHWAAHDEQSHRFGPAIFGKLVFGPHQVVKYNAALLFERTGAVNSNTLRAQVEYEF